MKEKEEGEDGDLHKGHREGPLQVLRGWHRHQHVQSGDFGHLLASLKALPFWKGYLSFLSLRVCETQRHNKSRERRG